MDNARPPAAVPLTADPLAHEFGYRHGAAHRAGRRGVDDEGLEHEAGVTVARCRPFAGAYADTGAVCGDHSSRTQSIALENTKLL